MGHGRVVLAVMMLAAPWAAAAQDKPCGKADASAAEKAVDRVVSWPALHKAWVDYRHCDAAAVDDLFTDALMRMLVEWKHPEALAAAMDADPRYAAFVLKHLRSPSGKEDRASVYSRATADCPASLGPFCARIAEASKP